MRRSGLSDWKSACALSVASETPDTEIICIARPIPIPSIKAFSQIVRQGFASIERYVFRPEARLTPRVSETKGRRSFGLPFTFITHAEWPMKLKRICSSCTDSCSKEPDEYSLPICRLSSFPLLKLMSVTARDSSKMTSSVVNRIYLSLSP